MDDLSDARLAQTPAARTPNSSRAASTVIIGSVLVRGLAFARLVGAARILNPEEVGRFALVMTVVGVFESIAQPGLQTAMVQHPNLRRGTVETAWAVLIVRGLLLALATLAAAPLITDLLDAPASTSLLQAAALTFVLRATISPAIVLRVRSVDLRPEVATQVLGAVTETAIALALAAAWNSAWALLVGLLAGAAVEAVASFRVQGFRPKLAWDLGEVRPLLRMSRWLFASSVLQYLSTAGDDLVVARSIGLGPLGLYRVAYRIANLPTTEISHAVGRIALPTLARQDELDRAIALMSFRRALAVVAGVAGGASAILIGAAGPLITAALGEEWSGATTALIILTASGYVRAVVATAGSLFAGLGRPELATLMLGVRAAVLFGSLAILVPSHGINGAATASLLSVGAMVFPWIIALRVIGLSARLVLVDVGRRIPAVLVTLLVSIGLARIPEPAAMGAALGAVGGAIAWLLATKLLDAPMWADYRSRISDVRARLS